MRQRPDAAKDSFVTKDVHMAVEGKKKKGKVKKTILRGNSRSISHIVNPETIEKM
jgi:hypothetical protein